MIERRTALEFAGFTGFVVVPLDPHIHDFVKERALFIAEVLQKLMEMLTVNQD